MKTNYLHAELHPELWLGDWNLSESNERSKYNRSITTRSDDYARWERTSESLSNAS